MHNLLPYQRTREVSYNSKGNPATTETKEMNEATAKTARPAKPPPPRWWSVLLPLLAGLLHFRTFYLAVFCCLSRAYRGASSRGSSEEFLSEIYLLDRAVFVAYAFDLACCWLGVIPFSRCHKSKDIVEHHLPTLLLALPLGVPLWGNFRSLEPTGLSILDLEVGNKLRDHFVNAYTLASGWAYASSLNEVFMCFQRGEMSLQGCDDFRDINLMRRGVFTSRIAVFSELCYKLCFFWGMSLVACKACCDFDKSLYDFATATTGGEKSMGKALLSVYSSPA